MDSQRKIPLEDLGLRWLGHLIGVFCILWTALGFAEWYHVLATVGDHGGPLPHIWYAAQLLALQAGAVALWLAVLATPTGLRLSTRLAYSLFPLTYLLKSCVRAF